MGRNGKIDRLASICSSIIVMVFLVADHDSVSLSAGSIGTVSLKQAVARQTDIIAYLEILDPGGKPVADLPPNCSFKAWIGGKVLSVGEVRRFDQSGEGTAYLLMVDASKSVREAQFREMRRQLQTWLGTRKDQDRIALLTFGSEVRPIRDFSHDMAVLKKDLDGITQVGDRTLLFKAIRTGAEMMQTRFDSDLPSRRVIVLVSDGEDDSEGQGSRQMALHAVLQSRAPIYAVGVQTSLASPRKEAAIRNLRQFAEESGGLFFDADVQPVLEILNQITVSVGRIFMVRLMGENFEGDNSLHLELSTGSQVFRPEIPLRYATSPASEPKQEVKVAAKDSPKGLEPGATESSKRAVAKDESSILQKLTSYVSTSSVYVYSLAALCLVAIVAGMFMLVRRRTTGGHGTSDNSHPRAGANRNLPEQAGRQGDTAVPGGTSPEDVATYAKAHAPAGVVLRFVPISGDSPGQSFEMRLRTRAVIGRSADECDVALSYDQEVSKRHCELVLEGEQVFVRDLGSTNGTCINGVPISGRYRLQQDDTILLGESEFRLSILSESTPKLMKRA